MRFFLTHGLVLIFTLSVTGSAISAVGPEVGQTAPEFSLDDMSGNQVTLKELRSKGYVMLLFWSTRCHFCHSLLPVFKQVHADHDGKQFTLVAINVGFEDKPEVDDYVLENSVPYLVLNEDDKKASIAESYQLYATPTIVLVSPGGKVVYQGNFVPENLKQLLTSSQ